MIHRPERELSEFQAQNLVGDHLEKILDAERERAFQKRLQGDVKLRDLCSGIQKAQGEIQELRATEVSAEVLEHFRKPQTVSRLFLDLLRFDDWPLGLKWSIESLAMLSVVVLLALILPWHEVLKISLPRSQTLVLSEFDRNPKTLLHENREKEEGHAGDAVTYPDEPDTPTEPTAVAKKENAEDSPPQPSVAQQNPIATASPPAAASKQGYLFRGQIDVTNLSAVAPKFVDKIGELGGRKAGEVPLGWKKGSGAYFHFTIPEVKYEALLNFIREYGDLKIQREKHERVMPAGIIRIIIQAEEKMEPQ